MRAGLSWLLVLALLGCSPLAVAWGQKRSEGAPTDAGESPKPVAGPTVEASPLNTFLLKDSKGNLVPVVGMTFEEFEQLLKLKKGLAPPPAPGFTLDTLSIAGTADGQVANLQITVTIRIREESGVRIPLLMPGAVMREPARYEGPGQHVLFFDEQAGGYVVWIRGETSQRHVLTLHATVGLTSAGDETRLTVMLPRATEASLRLTVPAPNVEAALAGGDGIVATRAVAAGQSEISAIGPAGDFQLGWRKGRETVAKAPAQLDASGDIRVRVESERGITSDARLTVRSYSRPLETFQVRLPPGMELVPLSLTGYTLTPLAGLPTPARKAPAGQLIEVHLEKPATAAEVRLLATWQADPGPSAALMPARFEVVGAVRQRGTIDFSVEGEWQLEFTEDASVQRLDVTADVVAPRRVAKFEYSKQPSGLQVRVVARPSRVSVEPTHLVHIEAQQLRLETTLKYHFRGSRVAGLTLDLGDWKLDGLAPDDLLDLPVVKSEPAGHMQAAFRLGIAPPTDVEFKLSAHRTLAPQTTHVALKLPRPVADFVAPATITIAPADNVELTPLSAEIVGLSPESTIVRIPGRQQSPLVFRDLGGDEPALFAATLGIRTRTTTASAHANVRLDRQQLQVEQRLDYRIVHEPKRAFTLLAPRGLAASAGLQVWFNNEPLSAAALPSDAGTERLEFFTPTDQIGSFPLTVRYSVPMPRWDGQQPLSLAIPLVVPADEANFQFAGQQMEFTLREGLQVEPDLSGVEEFSRPTTLPGGVSPHVFAWSKAATESRWIVQPTAAGEATAITISKTWVQTWITPHVRQERMALRINTMQDVLRVKLPAGVLLGGVQAAINAQTVVVHPRDPDQVRIDLPLAVRGRECVLEIGYTLEPPSQHLGFVRSELQSAQIEGAGPPRRLYWQISLPEDQYLLAQPADLSAEMTWSADRWLFARQPLLDQLQLEAWIDASRQDPLPRTANVYLFGTLGRLPSLEFVAAQRLLLVSLASGGALILGLLLVHVRRLRSPGALLAAAVLLGAVALAAPDLAVLVAQWSILGLLVALAAAAWTWLGSARSHWVPSPQIPALAPARESPSTRSPSQRLQRESPSSTATAPAGVHAAEVRP